MAEKTKEIPKGYKQTELGIIPEDWEIKVFNQVLKKIPNKLYEINSKEYLHSGKYPIIDQGQNLIVAYSNNAKKVFKCPKEGVIIFGDHTRKFKFVNFDFIVGADGTQILFPNEKYYGKFIFYQCLEKKIPNTGYNRHFKFLKEFIFLIPKYYEQTAIAQTLSDMDALIESLDKLIAKKKKIKQGAMQELLTGKRRLPGFGKGKGYKQTELGIIPEDWEVKRLGEIGKTYGGLTGKQKKDFDTRLGNSYYIPFLNVLMNIKINTRDLKKVYIKETETQNKVKMWDLFFNTSSETPEEVGMCAVLTENLGNTFLNSFCFGYRLKDKSINGLFLSYLINSKYGRKIFRSIAQGATRYNLSKHNFDKVEIILPPTIEEQTAIAQTLSDMDAEIEALEAKKQKYEKIKKGAMQLLLTGKIRLKNFGKN